MKLKEKTAHELLAIMDDNRWPVGGSGAAAGHPVDLYTSAVEMCGALVHGAAEYVGRAIGDEIDVALRQARRDFVTVVAVQDLLSEVQP